jgi:MORN repeat
MRHGDGRFYFANGDLYIGQWANDQMNGFGRYYYQAGQRFEGHFHLGQRNGFGKLQRTSGELDVFRYQADKRVGTGVRWSPDRTQAWKLETPKSSSESTAATSSQLRLSKISIAEAVSLVYGIENAMQDSNCNADLLSRSYNPSAIRPTADHMMS